MYLSRAKLTTLLLAALIFWTHPLLAHKEDYLDETLVYVTLGAHEFEPEYWIDYGYGPLGRHFLRHHLAVEYGLRDRWMVEARATEQKIFGGGSSFDSARVETRYRFGAEGSRAVDIAVSAELNSMTTEQGAHRVNIEPRLILSKDFREKLNVTLNLAEELAVNAREAGFAPAAGIRYNASRSVSVGSEFRYEQEERRGSIIPQIWFRLPKETTIKAGFSAGLGHDRRNFGRVAVEFEF